ncbi:MAG: hypothetical protein JNN00_02805 [Chitinophagaceae bacterium]|nr:hypothetical protein [Chitinophagaceae bacterium]
MQRPIILLLVTAMFSQSGCSQNNSPHSKVNIANPADLIVGGPCEGCEAIYECPVPFDQLNETDTLPGFNENGPKIAISGVIYQPDGKTPAPGVILYVYHTDQKGIYATKGDEKGRAKRHGYIRGWVKTNEKGEYRFYTLVPASYPNSNNPKHIHPTIKEPGKSEYWIDEFVFDDDPLLSFKERNRLNPRGGNGVLRTDKKGDILYAIRNIVLGLNVTDYPKQ